MDKTVQGKLIITGLLTALLTTSCLPQENTGAIGWASYGEEVVGGGNAPPVRVRNREQFLEATGEPGRVILVEDTIELIDGERIDIKADHLTIAGVGTGAMLRNGGISISGNNIIVRNLSIGDSYRDGHWPGKGNADTDAITIYGTHVWIDHCELFHSFDGLVDVSSRGRSHTGDLITISWTKFYNHNKVMLIGSNDQCSACRGKLRVTVHHCWFDGASRFYDTVDRKWYRIQQRMPRVRFGDVHVFNNYYEDVGDYAVAARFESRLYVEGNYFRNLRDPHIIRDTGMGEKDPEMVVVDNLYDNVKGERANSGRSFQPDTYYRYDPDQAGDLPVTIMNFAGKFNPEENRSPVARPDTFHVQEETEFSLTLLANDYDPDGDSIRIAMIEGPDQVRIVTYPGHILFRSDHAGTYNLTYRSIDFNGGVAEGTTTVIVEEKTE